MKDQLLKIYIFEIFSQKEFAIKSYEGFVDRTKDEAEELQELMAETGLDVDEAHELWQELKKC